MSVLNEKRCKNALSKMFAKIKKCLYKKQQDSEPDINKMLDYIYENSTQITEPKSTVLKQFDYVFEKPSYICECDFTLNIWYNHFASFCNTYKNHAFMKSFVNAKMFLYVRDKYSKHIISKPERQLFHDITENIHSICDLPYDRLDLVQKWSIDEYTMFSNKSETFVLKTISQFVKAYRHICVKYIGHGLSVELIEETYGIMFDGAVTNTLVHKGFRKRNVSAGQFQFTHPSLIVAKLTETINKFNTRLVSFMGEYSHDIVFAVADLYYELITIHPFYDGNGRFCELMLIYAFYACGFPFPCIYSYKFDIIQKRIGESAVYAHGLDGNRTYIYTDIALLMEHGWENFFKYIGETPSA